ncbi:hypothetical protein HDU98_004987, partial [Podochytrium sp. JEL0797]
YTTQFKNRLKAERIRNESAELAEQLAADEAQTAEQLAIDEARRIAHENERVANEAQRVAEMRKRMEDAPLVVAQICEAFESLPPDSQSPTLSLLYATLSQETRTKFLQDATGALATSEMGACCSVRHEAVTVDSRLNISAMVQSWKSQAPFVSSMISSLVGGVTAKFCMVMSMFEQSSSMQRNLLQKENGLVMLRHGVNSSVWHLLKEYGITASYKTALRTSDKYADSIASLLDPTTTYDCYKQILVLDNVERYRKTAQKASDHSNLLVSQTLRGYIPVTDDDPSLPLSPRIPIADLAVSDILPNDADCDFLDEHSRVAIRAFLIKNFKGFKSFPFINKHPSRNHDPVAIIPNKLSKDKEMCVDGMLNILTDFREIHNMTEAGGMEQIISGDGGSVINIHATICERKHDIYGSLLDRSVSLLLHAILIIQNRLLDYKTSTGEFHYKMCILRCNVVKYGWHTSVRGSLGWYGHKKNPQLNGNKFKFYEMQEIIMDVFDCYLWEQLETVCAELRFDAEVVPEGGRTESDMEAIISAILRRLDEGYYKEVVAVKPDGKGISKTMEPNVADPFQNYQLQFIKDVLLYKVLKSCVKHGDGQGLMRVHRLFLPMLKLYSTTYCSLITKELISMESLMSARCAYISAQNRFCNSLGLADSFTSLDWSFEKYVLQFKTMEKRAGTNTYFSHSQRVSMVAPTLSKVEDQLFHKLAPQTPVRQNPSRHSTRFYGSAEAPPPTNVVQELNDPRCLSKSLDSIFVDHSLYTHNPQYTTQFKNRLKAERIRNESAELAEQLAADEAQTAEQLAIDEARRIAHENERVANEAQRVAEMRKRMEDAPLVVAQICEAFESLPPDSQSPTLSLLYATLSQETRTKFLQDATGALATSEMGACCSVRHEAVTVDSRLNISAMVQSWKSQAPFVSSMISSLVGGVTAKFCMVMSMFEQSSSMQRNLLQKENGLVMLRHGVNSSVWHLLKEYGITASYKTALRTSDKYADSIASLLDPTTTYDCYKQILVLDNVERYRKTAQKASDHSNLLVSQTLRGYIPVTDDDPSLPLSPRIPIADLAVSDILPNDADCDFLDEHSRVAIRAFLIKNFKGFKSFPFINKHPSRNHDPVAIIPNKLSKDKEMCVDGMLNILTDFREIHNMTEAGGMEQIISGDGGSVINIHATICERKHDIYGSLLDRLLDYKTSTGEFHYKMCILRCNVVKYGWHTSVRGSLGWYGHKKNPQLNGNKFKFYEMQEIIMDVFDCYLWEQLETVCAELRFDAEVVPEGGRTESDMEAIISAILRRLDEGYYKEVVAVKPDGKGISKTMEPNVADPFQNYQLQFIKDVLLYKVLKSCVKHGDGQGLMRVHRLFLPMLKLYSTTYCSLITKELISMESLMSARCAYISAQNRFCNSLGLADSFTSLDWSFEKYVLQFKTMEKRAGTNTYFSHSQRVSMVAPTLSKVEDQLFHKLGIHHTGSHHHQNVQTDKDKKSFRFDLSQMKTKTLTPVERKVFGVESMWEVGMFQLNNAGYIKEKIRKLRKGQQDGGEDNVDGEVDDVGFGIDEDGTEYIQL